MTTAFATFKNEVTRPVLEKEIEKTRRGHVQICSDPDLCQRACLRGTASGQQHDRRAELADQFEMRIEDLGRREAENADAPALRSYVAYRREARERSLLAVTTPA